MAKYIARHAAAKQNHVARNATIAAAAGAVVLGSVAPANAYATANTGSASQSTANYQASNYSANGFNNFRSAHQGYAQKSSTASTSSVSTKNLSATRAKLVSAAESGLGGSYVWGGKSFKAWDCSGFVSYVYKQAGIDLTAYTYAMKNEVKQTSNPQPGDIVFTNGYSHVGIYVGNGKMISALNPTQGTQLTAVDGGGMMPVDGYYTAL